MDDCARGWVRCAGPLTCGDQENLILSPESPEIMKTLPLLLVLSLGGVAALPAADVTVYAVIKTQSFAQTATSAPALPLTAGFQFTSVISPATATSVTGGTLRLPSTVVKPFGPVPGFGSFAVEEKFDTLAAMNAVYASGNYAFTIHTQNDGTRTPTLAFTGSSFSSTPTVTNIADAQNIDWTQNFTLQWSPFTGSTSNNTVQVIITRSNGSQLFATPQFPASGALTSASTSVVIPANTFVPGETYTGTLAFANLATVNVFAYGFFDGVPGVGAFIKTTEFPLTAPGTTPVLHIAQGTAARSLDLSWNSDLGRTYDLRRSQDFVTWTRVALVTSTAATTLRTDIPAIGVTSRFYRLQQP